MMTLTEREARKNIKLNFDDVPRAQWRGLVKDLYGIDYDRTVEREILEILGEDLDGCEIELE